MKGILADLVVAPRASNASIAISSAAAARISAGARSSAARCSARRCRRRRRPSAADRPVHSLHGYFMRAGDVRRLDRLPGRPAARRQELHHPARGRGAGGRGDLQPRGVVPGPTRTGFDHQDAMPEVPAPETLRSERDLALAIADAAAAAPPGARHRRAPDRDPPGRAARPAAPDARPRRAAACGTAPSTSSPTTRRCTATCSPTRRTSRSSAPRSIRTAMSWLHARHAGGVARPRDVVPPPVPPRRLAALRRRQPLGVGRAAASCAGSSSTAPDASSRAPRRRA